MAKYIDENGLLYFWSKIKSLFVGKETGKGLSTNDYTTAEKNKLSGLSNYTLPAATVETLGGVKVGAGLSINAGVLSATGGGVADAVDWSNVQNKPSIPSKTSDLTNDSTFQTATQVTVLINDAISDITGISFEVVTALPATGEAGKIYLLSNSGASSNIYDEYIYYSGSWEKIGTTDIDLSNYLTIDDVVAITNAEIDAIVAA